MRGRRKFSKTQIYHILTEGNERKDIFIDNEDKAKILSILSNKNQNESFKVYAFCIMNNHLHLVLKEKNSDISTIMRRINTSYAKYFNKKYNRVGHVFHDRFKSEAIETNDDLLEVVKYIHKNPIRTNICNNMIEYKWSSFIDYIIGLNRYDFLDIEFVLSIFTHNNREEAIKLFSQYSINQSKKTFFDIMEKSDKKDLLTKKDVLNYIDRFIEENNLDYESLIKTRKNIKLRNKMISNIKRKSTFSIRDLAQILGVNRNIIQRAK